MSYANLAQMFFERARTLADRPRYRYRTEAGWQEVTWQAMADRVRALAAGLIDLGVEPGDRVALLSATRAEWMEVDFAILACGALTVPIYQSNLPAECGYIIANSGASVVVGEKSSPTPSPRSSGAWTASAATSWRPSSTPPAPRVRPRACSRPTATISPPSSRCSACRWRARATS